jgi:hypothetical protein
MNIVLEPKRWLNKSDVRALNEVSSMLPPWVEDLCHKFTKPVMAVEVEVDHVDLSACYQVPARSTVTANDAAMTTTLANQPPVSVAGEKTAVQALREMLTQRAECVDQLQAEVLRLRLALRARTAPAHPPVPAGPDHRKGHRPWRRMPPATQVGGLTWPWENRP